MSIRVARTAKGLPHRNTLNLRKVFVYFQKFAGKHGSDADRGIADVEYEVRVDGRLVDKGKTGADGRITVLVPAGASVIIKALGTEYDVKLVNRIEAKDQNKGQQQRLFLLGYEPGAADGTLRRETDLATGQFQADENLDPKGSLGSSGLDATTYNQLGTTFGE